MTIFNIEDQDHDDKYMVNVSNTLGMETYRFEIDVEGANDGNGGDNGNGDKPEKPIKTKMAASIVILCLLAILLLIVAFYIMYKKKMAHNETAPLSNLETRH